jgi:hypothetical protein
MARVYMRLAAQEQQAEQKRRAAAPGRNFTVGTAAFHPAEISIAP